MRLKTLPFYYGYVVWLVAVVIGIASSPGQSFTSSLFTDYFIQDLGLSRTAVSTLFGLGTFLSSLGLTWVGVQIDRHGNRLVGVVVAVAFALSVAGMSLVRNAFTLLLGFTLIRALGVGALTIIGGTAVAQWFQRFRARVVSWLFVIFSLVLYIYLPWLQALLEDRPWREVWLILGVAVAVLLIPIVALFMRDRPEDYGLLPDGASRPETADHDVPDEVNWTLRQARRTGMLWAFLSGRVVLFGWGTGLIFHLVSIFTQLGFDAAAAASALGLFSLVVAAAVMFSSFLINRIGPGWLLAIQLALQAVTLALLLGTGAAWLPLAFALVFGFSFGLGGVFDDTVWPSLFGRLHLGSIRGFTLTAIIIGTALGPVLFGYSFDAYGSYRPVLLLGILLSIVFLFLGLLVRKPAHPESIPLSGQG